MVILIFGDSVTYGEGDRESGWVQRLRKFLDEKTLADKGDFLVYNLGVDGNDTEDLLKRFNAEARARQPNTIIFAIGTNDSSYRKNRHNPLVSIQKFEKNLLKLIQEAKKISDKIVFIGLAKGNDYKTIPLPRSITGKCYDKENVKIYNNIIKKTCKEKHIFFINIINKLNDKDFYDGLHPSPKGHQKIFEIVKEYLITNKII